MLKDKTEFTKISKMLPHFTCDDLDRPSFFQRHLTQLFKTKVGLVSLADRRPDALFQFSSRFGFSVPIVVVD
jgi:hypothetical protein